VGLTLQYDLLVHRQSGSILMGRRIKSLANVVQLHWKPLIRRKSRSRNGQTSMGEDTKHR